MDERAIKETAIKRYEDGESPKQVYQSLGRSKRWFFKWLKRSRNDGPNWSVDISKRPHKTRKRINKIVEHLKFQRPPHGVCSKRWRQGGS